MEQNVPNLAGYIEESFASGQAYFPCKSNVGQIFCFIPQKYKLMAKDGHYIHFQSIPMSYDDRWYYPVLQSIWVDSKSSSTHQKSMNDALKNKPSYSSYFYNRGKIIESLFTPKEIHKFYCKILEVPSIEIHHRPTIRYMVSFFDINLTIGLITKDFVQTLLNKESATDIAFFIYDYTKNMNILSKEGHLFLNPLNSVSPTTGSGCGPAKYMGVDQESMFFKIDLEKFISGLGGEDANASRAVRQYTVNDVF